MESGTNRCYLLHNVPATATDGAKTVNARSERRAVNLLSMFCIGKYRAGGVNRIGRGAARQTIQRGNGVRALDALLRHSGWSLRRWGVVFANCEPGLLR